jgi:hypothetical protein
MFESRYQLRDDKLEDVKEELLGLPRLQQRAALAIRRTFDMLLDGVNTGRFRWDQLSKTEKTHCGTLIEINLQREFKFADGTNLDYTIASVDVDCKYSQNSVWMIPPEAVGQLCLVLWANDQDGVWSMGLVRARDEYINKGKIAMPSPLLISVVGVTFTGSFRVCRCLKMYCLDSVMKILKLSSHRNQGRSVSTNCSCGRRAGSSAARS